MFGRFQGRHRSFGNGSPLNADDPDDTHLDFDFDFDFDDLDDPDDDLDDPDDDLDDPDDDIDAQGRTSTPRPPRGRGV